MRNDSVAGYVMLALRAMELTTKFPSNRPKSLTVSVFPVPAGPAGAPPRDIPRAWESVI